MIRKTNSIAAIALLAMIFTFSAAQADDAARSDFYVGGYGGWEWTTTDASGSASSFNNNGEDGGLYAGYNLDNLLEQQNIDLRGGLEAHYGWTWNSGASGTVGGVPTSLDKRHEWGLDLRPGFAIPMMEPSSLNPYAILGFRQSTFSDTTNGDTTHNGFDLGLGAELVTYQHYGVRLDYTHVFYETSDGIKPNEDDLRIGLTYHF